MNPCAMLLRRIVIGSAVALLTACGGGGGGGGGGAAGGGQNPPPAAGNIPPTAAFTASPANGPAPLVVSFDGSSSNDPDGSVDTYIWDFDDGSGFAVGKQVSHTFDTVGDYDVLLRVMDDDGATNDRISRVSVSQALGQFSLSGRVRILPSSAIDSDVNDIAVAPTPNNNFNEAQPIPNPVTLGGFVSDVDAGEDGSVAPAGDLSDFFSISLTGSETLQLTVGDPSNATLALSLWTDQAVPQLVNSTVVAGASGSFNANVAGDYFVEVSVVTNATDLDASNYVLAIGQNLDGLATHRSPSPTLTDEFVPGEFLLIGQANGADLGMAQLSASGPVRLMRQETPSASIARGERRGGQVPKRFRHKLRTLSAIATMSKRRGVECLEPNYIRRAQLTPNDPLYGNQWHYPSINLPQAWDISTGDNAADPVIVAVVDTGVLLAHPDLQGGGKLVEGFDFIRDPARARDGNGIDPDPNDEGDLAYPFGSSFHGTHVAGTVGARTDNNEGGAGVSWGAKIMPVRVLGVDGGTSYDVIQGVRWAAGLSNDAPAIFQPAEPADIINLSLGSSGSSQSEQQTIDQVRSAGVIVIASAGNESSTLPSFPAAYNGVVSVSATNITKALASYSNRGATIDVAAPGGFTGTDLNGDGIGDGVISAAADDSSGTIRFGYAAFNGTSMAAPHVAGVAALMKAIHPGLTPTQFDMALSAGDLTEDRGAPGRDDLYGNGLIDAQKAVIAALDMANQGAPINPILVASPTSLNFGAFDTQFDVEIANAGGGAVTVNQATADQPWLSVAPTSVDAEGLGTYAIDVDRSMVANDGTYSGTVTFTSTANDAEVGVVMQRSSLNIDADAGFHYILLVDTSTGDPVGQVATNAVNGEYPFTFNNVAAGLYQIFAGTDSDNDVFICDGGEACGAFRTLDSLDDIVVNSSRSGLDFVSGFRVNISGLGANTNEDASGATIGIRRLPLTEANSEQETPP